jgi:hypothetical protein
VRQCGCEGRPAACCCCCCRWWCLMVYHGHHSSSNSVRPAKASGERCDDAVLCGTPTHSRGRVPHAAAIEAACWCFACCHWCVAAVLGVTGLPLHPACVWLHGTSRDAADYVWAALTPAAWRAADARSGLRRLSWGVRVQCTHTRTHSCRPKLGNTCEPHSDSP